MCTSITVCFIRGLG